MAGEFSLLSGDDDYHPMIGAADNHNIANGDESWYSMNNITNFAKATAVSGFYSMANSVTAIGRFVGATDSEGVDINDKMYQLDDDLGQYYQEHQTAVDAAAFLVTSIVPGTVGMKVYNAGSKALNAYRLGKMGQNGAEAIGLLPDLEQKLLSKAINSMGETGAKFSFTNPRILGALGASVTDDYLSGVAYMTAATAALNASPIFDEMDAGDIAANIFSTTPLMVGVSGLLRGAGIFAKAKTQLSAADQALNPYRAATELTPNAAPSDQIAAWALNTKQRPVVDMTLPGAEQKVRVMNKANDELFQKMRIKALDITDGDAVAARRLAEDVTKMAAKDVIPNLANMASFTRIADSITAPMASKLLKATGKSDDEVIALASVSKLADEAAALISKGGDPIAIKTKELISAGKGSVIISRATGETLDEILPLLGDTLKSKQVMSVVANKGLKVGDKMFDFSASLSKDYSVADLSKSRMDIEARHIYFQQAKEIPFDPLAVYGIGDLPALERRLADWNVSGDKVTVTSAAGEQIIDTSDGLRQFIVDRKLGLIDAMKAQGVSVQEISQRLNISRDMALDPSVIANPEKAERHAFAMQNSIYQVPQTGEKVIPYMEPTHYVARYSEGVTKQRALAKDVAKAEVYLANKERNYDKVMQALEASIGGSRAGQLPARTDLAVNDATRFGAGGQLFAFANGGYRSVESNVEFIGRWTHDVSLARRTATLDALNPVASQVAINKEALLEFNTLDTLVRKSGDKYRLVREGINGEGLLVNSSVIREAEALAAAQDIKFANMGELVAFARQAGIKMDEVLTIKNAQTADWIENHIGQNDARLSLKYDLLKNAGASVTDMRGTFYAPPIDPQRYPYFAMVRDISLGGGGVSTLIARTAEELQEQIAKVNKAHPELKVITKADSDQFFRALNEYAYDASITDNYVNSALKKSGILNFYAPPTDSPKMLDHYLGWHAAQETSLVRDFVNAKYGSEFSKIEALGSQSLAAEQATWRGKVADLVRSKVDNPWLDYRRTALAIPKNTNTVMQTMDEWITKVTDGAWNEAKSMLQSAFRSKNMEELDKLNAHMKAAGIGTPYADAQMEAFANMNVSKNVLYRFVTRANSILSSFTLGMDPMNALNNHIGSYVLNSAEVKHVLNVMQKDARFADVQKLIQQKVPGTEVLVSSPAKLIANGIKNFFTEGSEAKLKRFQALGLDVTELNQFKAAIADLTITGAETEGQLMKRLDSAFEKARKITGNTKAEQFNRFISADIMATLTDPLVAAGVMKQSEANAMMNTFINRTHGNFVASQRPQIFQGVVGQAVSLYQTYTWNLMQQLLRYVGNGERKTAVLALGIQGSLYGLQGLPGFNQLNNLIATSDGNPEHHDIYEQVFKTSGKDWAEWIMYGAGANAFSLIHPSLKTNLYNRGDINPRTWTVLPTNISEIPIVSQTAKMIGSMHTAFNRSTEGAALWPTILQGIEHMNLNRPLTGMAQVLNGRSTDNDGLMLSAVDTGHLEGWIRFAGVKPMGEAVALDAIYRTKTYQQGDKDAINTLGDAVRSKMRDGGEVSQEELEAFMSAYVAHGGNQARFNAWFARESNRADSSTVNEIATKNRHSFQSRYLQTVMGGEGMPVPVVKDLAMEEGEEGANQEG